MRAFVRKENNVKPKTAHISSEARPGKPAAVRCDALARWKASVETLVAVKAASGGVNPATGAKVLRLAELRGLIALLGPASADRRELSQLRRFYRIELRRLQAELAGNGNSPAKD